MPGNLMKQVFSLDDIEPIEMPKGFFVRLLGAMENQFSVCVIEAQPGSKFGVTHPEAELVYVLRGQVEYDDGRFVKANQAIINLPNVYHSGRITGEEPALFIEINLLHSTIGVDGVEST
jgi:mannose-6-phosphate isomerase-like protein (cupin superfamily)